MFRQICTRSVYGLQILSSRKISRTAFSVPSSRLFDVQNEHTRHYSIAPKDVKSNKEFNELSINQEKQKINYNLLPSSELFHLIENDYIKGESKANQRKFLFNAYVRERNIEKFEEMLAEGIQLNDENREQILEAYIDTDKLEKAEKLLFKYRKDSIAYLPRRICLINFIWKLYDHNNIEKIKEILTIFKHKPQLRTERNLNVATQFMDHVAESGNVDLVYELNKLLIDGNYFSEKNSTLVSLIKVHLNNDDVISAYNNFEKLSRKGFFPGKDILIKKLMEKNDTKLLQLVMDLIKTRIGPNVALETLFFLLIELRKLDKARSIAAKRMNDIRKRSFQDNCDFYARNGRYDLLESLLYVTDGIECDKSLIYEALLKIYMKQNDSQKIVELLCKCSAKVDIVLNQNFLKNVLKFLQEKHIEIPNDLINLETTNANNQHSLKKITKNFNNKLDAAIINEDVNTAITEWTYLVKKIIKFKTTITSDLLELILKKSDTKTALQFCLTAFSYAEKIDIHVLKEFIEKLASENDFDAISKLNKQMDAESRQALRFGRIYFDMFINADKTVEYFDCLTKDINESQTLARRIDLNGNIPRLRHLKLLQNKPELVEMYTNFARQVASKNVTNPIQVLWAHLFIINDPLVDSIYTEMMQYRTNLFESAFLPFYLIEENLQAKLTDYVNFVKNTNNNRNLIYTYEGLIRYYIERNRLKESCDILQVALDSKIPLYRFNSRLINNLRGLVQANGEMQFPG